MSGLSRAFFLLLAAGRPAPAAGQEEPASNREEARARYDAGVAAFEADDFGTALAELQESYRLFASLRTLYSVGLCQHALGDYPAAVRSLEQYLAEGGEEVPPDLRSHAGELLGRMGTDIARLEISVDVDGAEVRVDGAARGTSPLDSPAEVGPGAHVVEASLEGYVTATRRTYVLAGGSAAVTLALEPEAVVGGPAEAGEGSTEAAGGASATPAVAGAPVETGGEGGPPQGVSEQEWYGVGDGDYRAYVFETGHHRPLANWILDRNRESDEMGAAELVTGTTGPSWLAAGSLVYIFVDDPDVRRWMSSIEWALGGTLTLAAIILAIFDAVDYGGVEVAHPERLVRVPEGAAATAAAGSGGAASGVRASIGPGTLTLTF